MVIDMLNMKPQMALQLASWGGFSEQIEDYTRRGLQQQMNTPIGQQLQSIVDPYQYRDRLKQPKLIMLGTNDRYWPLEALNLYFPDLQGEKRILYVPNNDHGLKDLPRIVGTLVALHREAAGELKLANPSWQLREADGQLQLSIESDLPPAKVSAWIASSDTKDFRSAKWNSQAIESNDGKYRFNQPVPEKGYVAIFGETVYDTDGAPYYLSTNLKIAGGASK
jgi:PhoPQ-activated pathogenicity-related protein